MNIKTIHTDEAVLREISKNPTRKEATRIVPMLIKEYNRARKELTFDVSGLSAPQIGINSRIIITRIGKTSLLMINPKILWFSPEKEIGNEGCLSLPDTFIDVERSKMIKVSFINRNDRIQSLFLSDYDARVVQHEVDHLDGILMIDKKIK